MALLLGQFTWRWIWVGIAIAVVLILMPAMLWMGRGMRRHGQVEMPAQSPPGERPQDRSWTRAQVLRDARFYGLLPGLLAAPFVITGVLFHQVHLVEIKAWTLSGFAAHLRRLRQARTADALRLSALRRVLSQRPIAYLRRAS